MALEPTITPVTPPNKASLDQLRAGQDPDELTSSEPSDGEIEAENAIVLYRKSSDYRNRLHIQNELVPSVTACDKHHMIENLTPVSVPDDDLARMTSTDSKKVGLCVACVAARPDRFPAAVVQALVK